MSTTTPTITAYVVTTTEPATVGGYVKTSREVVTVRGGLPPLPVILRHLATAILDRAQDAGEDTSDDATGPWADALEAIHGDLERAAELAEDGVRYVLPDGATITADGFDADGLDDLVEGITTCALWTSCSPPEDDPDGETGGREHLEPTPELVDAMRVLGARFLLAADRDDVEAFCAAMGDPDGGDPMEYAGHTFYLSASGAGVCFADRAPSVPLGTTARAERHRAAAALDAAGGRGVELAELVDAMDLVMVCDRLDAAASQVPEAEHVCPYDLGDGTAGLG